ncbi:MAG TPA: S8 family serine peptidase [Capillimicrobium sp.]|nr:S8 family serine peptidase [Capillimicrobium sp.]
MPRRLLTSLLAAAAVAAPAASAAAQVAPPPAPIPNDPGRGTTPGGWQALQWNLLASAAGIGAPDAWANVAAAGRPGGAGVTVAVLDTGVAYEDRGRFRRSPDLAQTTFVDGYDFVDRDPHPDDENGHGTHVASTIAESTNNGIGLTGIAWGASVMPVRVLDSAGYGRPRDIRAGLRFAVRHGADVVNLSLEFGPTTRAREIRGLMRTLAWARRRGVLVVAPSGNEGRRRVALPARAAGVVAVGATTKRGCLADYSNRGRGLDLVAPGGGPDAVDEETPGCAPFEPPPAGGAIYQVTFPDGHPRRFGIRGEEGTSMAAPHVTATAALVIASGVLGPEPTPEALEAQLEATARDLGAPGPDRRYGAGLLNAATATAAAATSSG